MDLMSLENECLRYSNVPIMQAIVKTESSFNPFAIGVVGGKLARQPVNKEEAVATALSLRELGYNYSMGLAQVNQRNLAKYGLDHSTVFDTCANIKTGSLIFNECHERAVKQFGQSQSATYAALSCYYSGNFKRGQQREGSSPSYVERVVGHMQNPHAIPVTKIDRPTSDRKSRKIVGVINADRSPRKEKVAATWDVFSDF